MKFTPEYKNVSNRSIIRFVFRDKREVVDYQFEMLKNNRIEPLLSCEALTVDGEIRLSYDITSLVTLKKILERKEIGRKDFVDYLKQVSTAFDRLEGHLLDYGGIILDSEYIYCSPSDNRLYFIYIPDKNMKQDINEPLRDFIMSLVIREMHFKNENADDYIQRVLSVLKATDFSLKALKSYLENLDQNRQPAIEIPLPAVKPEVVAKPHADKPTQTAFKIQAVPGNAPAPIKPAKQDTSRENGMTELTKMKKKKVYPLKSYLVLGAVIIVLAPLFTILAAKGSFKPGNPDMLTTLVGLLLVGGAITYLVCSKAFAADKKVEKVYTTKIKIPAPAMPKPDNPVYTAIRQEPPSNKVEYVNKAIRKPESMMGLEGYAQAAPAKAGQKQASDRTVLLSEKNITMPAIKRLGTNQETVIIKCWPFRVGRLEDQVDYCVMNPAVGKLHAELIKKPDGFFITDMNTRNGTFINGEKVDANSEHQIRNGDKIVMANEEFLFFE